MRDFSNYGNGVNEAEIKKGCPSQGVEGHMEIILNQIRGARCSAWEL